MSNPPPGPVTAPPTIIVIRERPSYVWGDYENRSTTSTVFFWVFVGVSLFLVFSIVFSSCYWRDDVRVRCKDDGDDDVARSTYKVKVSSSERRPRRQYVDDGDGDEYFETIAL